MNPFPQGKFATILMDPPWGFRTFSGEDAVPTMGEAPYPTMTLDELKELPLGEVAADDCLLIMWVISSHIPQAIELAEHWGFTYRSLGPIWVKAVSPDQLEMFDDAPISELGMGYWFRQQAEIALVFGKGSPTRLSAGVRQVFWAPRREHSRKPEGVHARIERLVAGPYLEMFARQERPGWASWGNETAKFGEAA